MVVQDAQNFIFEVIAGIFPSQDFLPHTTVLPFHFFSILKQPQNKTIRAASHADTSSDFVSKEFSSFVTFYCDEECAT